MLLEKLNERYRVLSTILAVFLYYFKIKVVKNKGEKSLKINIYYLQIQHKVTI